VRLAYVLDGFPHPSETFVLREVVEAARRFEVTIVVLTREGEGVRSPEVDALAQRVVRLPDVSGGWGGALARGALHPVRFARALAAANRGREEGTLRRLPRLIAVGERLRREGVDRIHAHFARWATAAAEVLSAWTGAPFGFTAHAYDVFAQPLRLAQKARAASWRVTCSDAAHAEVARRIGPEAAASFRTIRHGVDLTAWSPSAGEGMAAGRAPSPRLRVTAAGNFVPKKGFDVLLDAAALLAARGAPVDVRLFGDGPLEADLRRRAGPGAALLARVPAEELRRVLIEETDVLAFPARTAKDGDRDGLPNVVGEAAACGVPTVGTAVGGLPEMCVDGETGLVVPEGDARALADALLRLAGDADLRARLSRGARARAEAVFDARKNLDAFFAVLESGGAGR
jgi:colanic acid/amylovoran biosynthesis glycosyltransferase